MGYSDSTDDMEKLRVAFGEITQYFGSVDNLLEAFGLSTLPTAQRYGILFGFLVFVCTVSAVMALLILGGSFRRMAEQAETHDPTLLSSYAARSQRPLLLETLLESRERMMRKYAKQPRTQEHTPLTEMLLSVAPDPIVETNNKENKATKTQRKMPPQYQENYVAAYRTCQDSPGGTVLSGRPEARFEAYARGYAGCGAYTSTSYRRSYARLYESICCVNEQSDDRYVHRFQTRPQDIIGRSVLLEALKIDRHLKDIHTLTSGDPSLEKPAFDPDQVWGFLPEGPFANATDLAQSFVFCLEPNQAAFCMVHSITERPIGVVRLTQDDPSNLSIQLEAPIVPPDQHGSKEQLEACFLLLDRLFATGYRRIQMAVDSQDAESRKLAVRLGCTLEGLLVKHCIVKEASRDSNLYSLTNTDWKQGARAALFRKLYGAQALAADRANEKKEAELEEQRKGLAEQNAKKLA